MKKLASIFLLLSFCGFSQSLNIVPNSSFEDPTCTTLTTYSDLTGWYIPNQGSPDLLNFCNTSIQTAKIHEGYSRVAMILYDSLHINQNVRECVANKLIASLKPNQQYCLNLYIIPFKDMKYGIDKFGVYFGAGTQIFNTGGGLIPVIPQLSLPSGIFIYDTANWYNFKSIYTAQGGETDIIIGNFTDDLNTNLQVINSSSLAPKMCYLIIDDVSLYEMSINSGDTAVTCPQNMIATIGETNADTAFKNYYWYDAAGVLFDSVNAQIQVQPLSNTFYVQEKRMCGQSLWDTVFVKIDTVCPPEPATPEIELIIPNVFSPNGDGINDIWKIELPASSTLQFIEVYDRWGIKIAASSDLTTSQTDKAKTIQWFGRTTSGVACSEGVYYYMLELKNSKGETEKHKGYVSLFR